MVARRETQAASEVRPRRGLILFAVLLALFLASLDQTVVGTALPRIVSDLRGDNLYTWVVTSYLLTSTVTVPIYGKLSDVFGRKPMLLLGVALFLAGSALSGQAQTMNQLIAFRGVQGLGAGALFPIALAVIGDLFSPRERGRYQGLFGAVFGVSFIIGPLVGGFLTDHVSWRWVFYVNLPVGLVALLVIILVMPNLGRTGTSATSLDYGGIAVLTVGLVCLLLGLSNKGQYAPDGHLYSWLSWQVGGLLLMTAVLLPIFILLESRVREPVIPLSMFGQRTRAATLAAVFFMGFAMFVAIIYLPRFYQSVRGVSATESGYMIWPLLVGLIGASIGAGALMARTGRYKVLLVVSTAMVILASFLLTHMAPDTPDATLWGWMLLLGAGVGPGMAGFTTVIQAAVPMRQLGVATSTLTLLRQVGGSIGLAISGTIFNSTFTSELPKEMAAHGVPSAVANPLVAAASSGQLASVGAAASLPPRIVSALHAAETTAIAQLFWLSIAAAAAALVCTLLLEELPLRSGPSLRQEQAEELIGATATGPDEVVAAAAASTP